MKCFYNVENDYGLILRVKIESDKKLIWLENIRDPKKEYYWITNDDGKIINKDAYDFVNEKTEHGFDRNNKNCYENYTKLFEIMGIQKLITFNDLMKEKKLYVTELSRVARIPRTTISRISVCVTPFEKVTVGNALAISKAMNMTIEEVYDKLYFERTKAS